MIHKKRMVSTGASSVIGAALTRALASEGHTLYVWARRDERLNEVTENNTLALGYRCDVTQEDQVADFASWVSAKSPDVDVLINCASRYGAIGPLLQTDSNEWFGAVEVNLFGTYLMVKHMGRLLPHRPRSRIINLAGGGAFVPLPNYSAYAVPKAAWVRLT